MLPRRAPVIVRFLLLVDAVPGIVSGCNCSVLLFPSVFVLYSRLGRSSKCALIGIPRRSARVAARLKEQSSRTQNEDEDDDSGGLWCSCRQPQGDRFVTIRGRNVFTGTMVIVSVLHLLRADVWKVKVNLLFVHFVLQYLVCHPSVHLMPLTSRGGLLPLVGRLFVNRFIMPTAPLFTGSTIFFGSLR